jgi:hypothetical protein
VGKEVKKDMSKEVNNPILVHMAQRMAKLTLKVTLRIELLTKGVRLVKNFTLCDLNNFEAILGNTFLDVYKVDIFRNAHKARVCTKINLNA